jgi:hypothetical protein
MKAINPEARAEYICECDRDLPKEQQTVFEIIQLTAEEQAFLKDVSGMQGSAINAVLALGLVAVRYLPDASGNPVELKRDLTARPVFGKKKPWANLTVIPMKERDEIAARILKGAELEDSTVKNS